jgi:arsenate reductase (thioredoxin)
VFERYGPEDVRAESAGSHPEPHLWPDVIEVMREVDIEISGRKPKRLTVEMQLHADWAITMGCGDVCPYVPTTVDDWDIPDPARRPIDEVREIRDMIDERVRELATNRIDAIRHDANAHNWRLAKPLPQLIDEFGETRAPGVIRGCAGRVLDGYDDVPIRSQAQRTTIAPGGLAPRPARSETGGAPRPQRGARSPNRSRTQATPPSLPGRRPRALRWLRPPPTRS